VNRARGGLPPLPAQRALLRPRPAYLLLRPGRSNCQGARRRFELGTRSESERGDALRRDLFPKAARDHELAGAACFPFPAPPHPDPHRSEDVRDRRVVERMQAVGVLALSLENALEMRAE
jgi:hypothetical protein